MNDTHEFLGAYCTGALDPQERSAFEEHLADCADCRDEAADFREVLGALADAHSALPPNSLEDAVLAGVRADAPHALAPGITQEPAVTTMNPDSTSTPAHSAWRRTAPWIAAAAAGAVLFTGGYGLGRQQAPTQTAPGNAGDMAAVVAVASAADAHVMPVDIMGTTSRLVMSGEMDQSVFLASELPTPSRGMVYQVWAVTDEGHTVSAGSFTPDVDGRIAVVLDSSATGVDKFIFTIEPPGGSEHPTGELVAEIHT